MPTVKLDTIETIEIEEVAGNVQRLVRKGYVLELTADDYSALAEALSDGSIPVAGSSVSEAPNCVLTKRSVRMIDKDKAEFILTYEYALNEFYNMDSPPFGVVFGEGSSSLQQKPTNVDKNDYKPSVEYTYPNPFAPDPKRAGKLFVTGGEMEKLCPQHTLKFQGIKSEDLPGTVARTMEGMTNDGVWNGGEAGTWMCTAVNYKLFDPASSPARYIFNLEFQYNPDGWDPDIVFIDDLSGKPPADLTPSVGYKVVELYDQIDFNVAFGAVLVGE